jgi:hypothetical protein
VPDHPTPDATALAVLGVLLTEPIGPWSEEEIIRHMTDASTSFEERDPISVALRALVGDGLVHPSGGFYFASRAALAANALFAVYG